MLHLTPLGVEPRVASRRCNGIGKTGTRVVEIRSRSLVRVRAHRKHRVIVAFENETDVRNN